MPSSMSTMYRYAYIKRHTSDVAVCKFDSSPFGSRFSPRFLSSCSRPRLVNQRQDNVRGRHNGGCM